jgi:hypothetical protein
MSDGGLRPARTELAAGQYQVVVLGYALESQFELTVELVEPMRELRPLETLALGQVRLAPQHVKRPWVDTSGAAPFACVDHCM